MVKRVCVCVYWFSVRITISIPCDGWHRRLSVDGVQCWRAINDQREYDLIYAEHRWALFHRIPCKHFASRFHAGAPAFPAIQFYLLVSVDDQQSFAVNNFGTSWTKTKTRAVTTSISYGALVDCRNNRETNSHSFFTLRLPNAVFIYALGHSFELTHRKMLPNNSSDATIIKAEAATVSAETVNTSTMVIFPLDTSNNQFSNFFLIAFKTSNNSPTVWRASAV